MFIMFHCFQFFLNKFTASSLLILKLNFVIITPNRNNCNTIEAHKTALNHDNLHIRLAEI